VTLHLAGYILEYFFTVALRPNAGHGLLILEVCRSQHNDAPQSVELLWTSDQLVAETSTSQHTTHNTNIHAPGGIRTHDLSMRAAADLRLTPRGILDYYNMKVSHLCSEHFLTHTVDVTLYQVRNSLPTDTDR